MIDLTKNFVPESYSESRDYRVFLRLASILISVLKNNIDSTPSLYSSDDCPKELLSLLAEMVGYKYVETRSVKSNRTIIRYFPFMLRYRGSRIGIKTAAALSLNSEGNLPEYSLDNIIVEFDYDKGVIKIYYPQADALFSDLIEAVRPLGCSVEMIPSFISKNNDELDVKVVASSEEEMWNPERSQINKSSVGFGDVNTLEEKETT